ncbi:hypothetical protein [Necropsobacter rosorum]|uniref:hypothetical protein n=1 Tax=Necropsobacter rosorum TaxID=908285 RepID=UPI000509FA66
MNLFNSIIPTERQHKHFKQIISRQEIYKMDLLQEWANGIETRDGGNKFITEFQSTFNSSFWEIYLFAVLKKFRELKGEQFEINLTYDAPDFYLPNLNIGIEATVALNASDEPSEDTQIDILKDLPEIPEFNRRSIIRLANAITAKFNKYQERYKHLSHMKDAAYVIALQDFSQPLSHTGANRSIEAVLYDYYVDEQEITLDPNSMLHGEQLGKVVKNNLSEVPLGLFNTDKYSDISAIIFNPLATMGKVNALSSNPKNDCVFTSLHFNSSGITPTKFKRKRNEYTEHLFDGMYIYYNPFAKRPINPNIFEHNKIANTIIVNGEKYSSMLDGFLLFRNVWCLDKWK